MLAVQNGNADVVRLLLEAGASTEARDIVSIRDIYMHMCVCVLYSFIIVYDK